MIHGDLLRARGAEGKVIELDRGQLANLRAEANRVHWTNSGVERSAELS